MKAAPFAIAVAGIALLPICAAFSIDVSILNKRRFSLGQCKLGNRLTKMRVGEIEIGFVSRPENFVTAVGPDDSQNWKSNTLESFDNNFFSEVAEKLSVEGSSVTNHLFARHAVMYVADRIIFSLKNPSYKVDAEEIDDLVQEALNLLREFPGIKPYCAGLAEVVEDYGSIKKIYPDRFC